ncbi:hypothetical protein NE857_31505 [Nocardiopsis exhalans]|uniref:Uncharacterized protein n=1 Tax=Nocardiopsis exhalans TaxID=163604 RepID=A0ABY5D9C6_9ACTN|nr:hypothetical protein [Nocardiopsis exhalans]USY19706.1 hypothetical protein NE857_31505 [Nocardiopsis exhalans]
MTAYPCDLCDRPSGDDARVCTTCTGQATTALNTVADWLADDLVTATAKQTALGGGRGGGKPTKASEAPMPIDPRASEAAAILRNTLSTWVRALHAEIRVDIIGPACRACRHRSCTALRATRLPADTIGAMAAWLTPLLLQARHLSFAAELVDEITAAVAQALRAVDRPIRYVPLPDTCRMMTLDGQTPRRCGGALRAVIAPGLPIDRQVRCEVSRDHTSTVEAEQQARRRAARVARRLART